MIDSWSTHFWNGIKFDYPMCCVLWYCNCVTNYGEQRDSLFERMFREILCAGSTTEKEANFSDRNMCIDCILQRLITLQKV